MIQLKTEKELKKYSILSKLGLFIFIVGTILGVVQITNNLSPHFLGVGLIFLSVGWFIFSVNHSKIAIDKVQRITRNYIESMTK